MSHFAVLVIKDPTDSRTLDELLEPFDECDEDRYEFVDKTAQVLDQYETHTASRVKVDGELYSPCAERFCRPASAQEVAQIEAGERTDWIRLSGSGDESVYSIHDHSEHELVSATMAQIYGSVDNFAREYGFIKHKGRYGYMANPNAKWDWWQLGGRFTNYFKVKDSARLTDDQKIQAANSGGFVDTCRKGDIDITGMRADAIFETSRRWAKFEALTAGLQTPMSWEAFKAQGKADGLELDEIREKYHDQPMIKALSAANLMPWGEEPRDYWCMDEADPRQAYLGRAADRAITSYAVLHQGTWYERGEMGWWGMAHNEKDEDEWNRQFADLFDGLDEDAMIYAVDCHI